MIFTDIFSVSSTATGLCSRKTGILILFCKIPFKKEKNVSKDIYYCIVLLTYVSDR
jgi:hypothetical protein